MQLAKINLGYTAWPQALYITALPGTHVLPDEKLRARKSYGSILHLVVKRRQTWIRLQSSWFSLHTLSYLLAYFQPCDLWFFFVYNLTPCLVEPSFFRRQEEQLSSSPFSPPQNKHRFGYPEESNIENKQITSIFHNLIFDKGGKNNGLIGNLNRIVKSKCFPINLIQYVVLKC